MGLRDGRTDRHQLRLSPQCPHFGGRYNKFCNRRGWSSSGNKMNCERLNRNQVTKICRLGGCEYFCIFAFTKLDLDVTNECLSEILNRGYTCNYCMQLFSARRPSGAKIIACNIIVHVTTVFGNGIV